MKQLSKTYQILNIALLALLCFSLTVQIIGLIQSFTNFTIQKYMGYYTVFTLLNIFFIYNVAKVQRKFYGWLVMVYVALTTMLAMQKHYSWWLGVVVCIAILGVILSTELNKQFKLSNQNKTSEPD